MRTRLARLTFMLVMGAGGLTPLRPPPPPPLISASSLSICVIIAAMRTIPDSRRSHVGSTARCTRALGSPGRTSRTRPADHDLISTGDTLSNVDRKRSRRTDSRRRGHPRDTVCRVRRACPFTVVRAEQIAPINRFHASRQRCCSRETARNLLPSASRLRRSGRRHS